MNAFAGFWVDGAVRKPERRHGDSEGDVLIKTKTNSLDLFLESYSDVTSGYYWLDTTPRESLTPEEALSVIQMIYPQYTTIEKYEHDNWRFYGIDYHMPIDWGNLTQYPLLVDPQWVRVTRENVGQYLFRECRFRDADIDKWNHGTVAGWCETESRALVNSDFNDEMYVMNWNIVEVQNAN